MTTYSSVLTGYANTQTTQALKDLMNSVVTLMTNAGFAKSTESGELDINSVTYASTGNYGFQVWYLNDSYHASYPIYIRLYWKMASTNTVALAYTVGHSTDGAGNILGFKNGSDSTYLYSSTAWGTVGQASKACSLDGYGFWMLCPPTGSTTLAPWLMVTREWDATTGGIANNGNYAFIYRGGTTYQRMICVNRADSLISDGSTYAGFGFAPSYRGASIMGSKMDVFRVISPYPNRGYTISGSLCLYHNTELTQWSTFSANILGGGSARTFTAMTQACFQNASDSTPCGAVLWE